MVCLITLHVGHPAYFFTCMRLSFKYGIFNLWNCASIRFTYWVIPRLILRFSTSVASILAISTGVSDSDPFQHSTWRSDQNSRHFADYVDLSWYIISFFGLYFLSMFLNAFNRHQGEYFQCSSRWTLLLSVNLATGDHLLNRRRRCSLTHTYVFRSREVRGWLWWWNKWVMDV